MCMCIVCSDDYLTGGSVVIWKTLIANARYTVQNAHDTYHGFMKQMMRESIRCVLFCVSLFHLLPSDILYITCICSDSSSAICKLTQANVHVHIYITASCVLFKNSNTSFSNICIQ